MSVLLIITDGMADEPIALLNHQTPLEVALKPNLDTIARLGQNGLLRTTPEGWEVGSDVACLSILGYDVNKHYPARSVLEAAQMDITINEEELVMRCNLITLEDDKISSFTADHISSAEAKVLIDALNVELKSEFVKFYTGNSYRHILKINQFSRMLKCILPHNHIDADKSCLYIHSSDKDDESLIYTLNQLIDQAQTILANHPINQARISRGLKPANAISLWAPGGASSLPTLNSIYPTLKKGTVISAVDLIKGIGKLAGFEIINVDGATGLADTNYQGKAKAAIQALQTNDIVLLHIEAPDEASHEGNLELKLKTIEDIDAQVLAPILRETKGWSNPPLIVLLPDHITSTTTKTHQPGSVPFTVYHPSLEPDQVQFFSESEAKQGVYQFDKTSELMDLMVKLTGASF